MSLERKVYSVGEKTFEIYIYIDEQQNLWFKAGEVALALGYFNTRNAILKHVNDEDKLQGAPFRDGLELPSNWQSNTIFINESGLYSLILRSKKPEAKQFNRWVTSEVLPSIRKTGAYVSPDITNSQLSELLDVLKKKDEQIAKYNDQIAKRDEKIFQLMDTHNEQIAIHNKQIATRDEKIFKLIDKIV